MTVTIRQIHIENFRSIQRLTISADKLSVFVGKNDSGKSNILRALNLFFNGVTNPGKPFNFEDDYNLFVPERAKTAKEVVVRLELNIPSSYHSTNGEIIAWEKRWRSGGLHLNRYWGYRLSTNRRAREVRTQVDIPERSNAHGLLRQIEFEYVPAIKDSSYFDDLRGRIYSIIAEVATRTFRTSSTAFEDSIGEHLADLTTGNVDVGPLMDELKAIDAIRLYEIDGRKYGAIRNFRVFQRPKSPNDVHPMPDDFRKYVGLASGISPAFPRKGEIAPQVEDGEEDVGKQKGKKEGGASAHRTSEEFAFEGRTIRLKRADLDQWQTRFYAIPDITAELTALDGWLGKQSAEKRKGWFHSVPGMLNRKHQEMVSASRAVLATSDDEELPIA